MSDKATRNATITVKLRLAGKPKYRTGFTAEIIEHTATGVSIAGPENVSESGQLLFEKVPLVTENNRAFFVVLRGPGNYQTRARIRLDRNRKIRFKFTDCPNLSPLPVAASKGKLDPETVPDNYPDRDAALGRIKLGCIDVRIHVVNDQGQPVPDYSGYLYLSGAGDITGRKPVPVDDRGLHFRVRARTGAYTGAVLVHQDINIANLATRVFLTDNQNIVFVVPDSD